MKQDRQQKVKKKTGKLKKNELQAYSMALIPVLLVFVFNYLPIVGLVIAFKDYKFGRGIWGSEWVGFDNFVFFFKSTDFTRTTGNTLRMEFIFMVTGMISAIAVALLLYHLRSRNAAKIYQTVMITPNFISWVVAAYMVYAFLNPRYGMVNAVLEKFGQSAVDWYAKPDAWPFILTIANIWKHVGMDSVLYYASLMGIDSTYFEAARVDGANGFQVVKNIMLPMLVPLICVLSIMKVGGIFNADFGLFYQLTRDSGLLYKTTDVIDTYIFRAMRGVGNMGMSTAVGLVQSLVGLILVLGTNHIVKKINADNALL